MLGFSAFVFKVFFKALNLGHLNCFCRLADQQISRLSHFSGALEIIGFPNFLIYHFSWMHSLVNQCSNAPEKQNNLPRNCFSDNLQNSIDSPDLRKGNQDKILSKEHSLNNRDTLEVMNNSLREMLKSFMASLIAWPTSLSF